LSEFEPQFGHRPGACASEQKHNHVRIQNGPVRCRRTSLRPAAETNRFPHATLRTRFHQIPPECMTFKQDRNQIPPDDTEIDPTTPDHTRCHQLHQISQVVTKSNKITTCPARSHQTPPGPTRCPQITPGHTRSHHIQLGPTRPHKIAPDLTRSHQTPQIPDPGSQTPKPTRSLP
jgi:hypothetical protein